MLLWCPVAAYKTFFFLFFFKRRENQHLPKLSDELSEDVLQFGSEVSPHVVLDAPNALHLNKSQRVKSGLNEMLLYNIYYRIPAGFYKLNM